MALDYDIEGEVLRLVDGCKVRRPTPVRDRWGRWHRDPAGEYDWLYQLPSLERAYVSRNYMSAGGTGVDVLATMAGMDVDAWAEAFVGAIRAARSRKLADCDPLSDDFSELTEYSDSDVEPDEILGPVEVAELLGVTLNTVTVWARRTLRGEQFPEPFKVVSSTRLWRRRDIEAWAKATGREVVEP